MWFQHCNFWLSNWLLRLAVGAFKLQGPYSLGAHSSDSAMGKEPRNVCQVAVGAWARDGMLETHTQAEPWVSALSESGDGWCRGAANRLVDSSHALHAYE